MAKKKTPKFSFKRLEKELLYNLTYDYDHNYHCDSHGCSEDGICRCGTIANLSIEKMDIRGMVDDILGRAKFNPRDLKHYCLDRYLRAVFQYKDPDALFELNVRHGYYGQEVDSAEFSNREVEAKIVDFLAFLEATDDSTLLVEKVLEEEYGYILPKLEGKEWKSKEVNIDLVKPSNDYVRLDKDLIASYEADENFSCLCVKEGKYYRVVDGYHRYNVAKKHSKKIVVVFCE